MADNGVSDFKEIPHNSKSYHKIGFIGGIKLLKPLLLQTFVFYKLKENQEFCLCEVFP